MVARILGQNAPAQPIRTLRLCGLRLLVSPQTQETISVLSNSRAVRVMSSAIMCLFFSTQNRTSVGTTARLSTRSKSETFRSGVYSLREIAGLRHSEQNTQMKVTRTCHCTLQLGDIVCERRLRLLGAAQAFCSQSIALSSFRLATTGLSPQSPACCDHLEP